MFSSIECWEGHNFFLCVKRGGGALLRVEVLTKMNEVHVWWTESGLFHLKLHKWGPENIVDLPFAPLHIPATPPPSI